MSTKKTTISEQIVTVLKRRKTPATSQQIQNLVEKRFGSNPSSVARNISYMAKSGTIVKRELSKPIKTSGRGRPTTTGYVLAV